MVRAQDALMDDRMNNPSVTGLIHSRFGRFYRLLFKKYVALKHVVIQLTLMSSAHQIGKL